MVNFALYIIKLSQCFSFQNPYVSLILYTLGNVHIVNMGVNHIA